MNRFDEFAVEAAVQLKETLADVRIDVLSVGPEAALAVIKRAIGMGADRGVLLDTGGPDRSRSIRGSLPRCPLCGPNAL